MSRHQCEDCGDASRDVARGVGDRWLCERCASDYVDCGVCDETHDADSTCRHVYWAPGVGWCGAGSVANGPDVAQDDFLSLLPRLDAVPGLVSAVLESLRCDAQVIHDWRDEGVILFHQRPEFVPDGYTEADESIRAGWDWLASLDGAATSTANAATAKWIGDWLRERETADADV